MTAVKADDNRPGINRLDPPGQIGHEHAMRLQIVGIGIVGEQIALLPLPDPVNHPVASKVDDRNFCPASLLG